MKSNLFDDKYFQRGGYSNVDFKKKFTMYWWSCRFYAGLIKRFVKKGKILDVGCGLGHVLGNLERNFETVGIDVNKWAINEAKINFPKSRFYTLSAEKLDKLGKESFEGVLMRHLVEHLKDPFGVILKVKKNLKDNGILLVATPNPDNPMRILLKDKWIGYKDPTHISIKSPSQWADFLETNGFKILLKTSDGFWATPYLPIIPLFIQKILFGILGGIQAITGFVFLPVNWGESLILIAQKK